MENDKKELCPHVQEEGGAEVQAAGAWWGPRASKRLNRWCELQHFGFGLQHGLIETVCLIHSKIPREAQTSLGTHLPHLFQNNELCLTLQFE